MSGRDLDLAGLADEPEQQVPDLKQNASVMQDSISVTRGPSTIASKWLLTKKFE